MAWEEWEQLKAEASGKRSAAMQLNTAATPNGGGGNDGGGDLRVTQKDLAAIGDSAFRLRHDLDRFSGHARISSMAAAEGLKSDGFALGRALDHVAERWVDQVQSLLDACAHISNHLDFTKRTHEGDEVHISGIISSISTLDKGFDESSSSPRKEPKKTN
ncbi:hypothetical protein [Streptomyces sp. NPDC087300]|uniref:hypothetical protein n=1 Tax=Streptomyces sp. NPDC087300 TaxID=3365780 RepID=UPI00381AD584